MDISSALAIGVNSLALLGVIWKSGHFMGKVITELTQLRSDVHEFKTQQSDFNDSLVTIGRVEERMTNFEGRLHRIELRVG